MTRGIEGDGENGLEIYFENEENKKIYMEMELEDKKALKGNTTNTMKIVNCRVDILICPFSTIAHSITTDC